MAYGLFISPPEGAAPTLTPQAVVSSFVSSGIACQEQPDQYGHWLVLGDYQSTLNLTVKDGVVIAGGFCFDGEDDESIIQRVTEVFKSLGWEVGDDEGLL